MNRKIVNVGVGQLRVAKPPAILVTNNLGSCVGVALYDGYHKIGGLAHITLPSYRFIKDTPSEESPKFADSAIPLMIKKMEEMGAQRFFTTAKIAGGGDMFSLPDTPFELDIGRQNVEAVRKYLQEYSIKVVAEEVLDSIPRTMGLDLNTGKVILRTAQRKTRFL